jgi:hypothetical protein
MFKNIKRIPYALDILILTAIPVITIIEHVHIHTLCYRNGFRNLFSFSFIFLPFIYEPLKVAVIILAIVRLCIVKHAKMLNKYFITVILSILMFIGSWILPFYCFQPGAFHFLKGYEKWVSKNVDVKAIQTWLLSGEADKYIGNSYGDKFPDDFPNFLINFEPNYISFHAEYSERGKCIEIETGLGLDIWGIVVTSPTTKTIQNGTVKDPDTSYVEYRRPIMPGVYIFHGG